MLALLELTRKTEEFGEQLFCGTDFPDQGAPILVDEWEMDSVQIAMESFLNV
jgi:hypothetical protein